MEQQRAGPGRKLLSRGCMTRTTPYAKMAAIWDHMGQDDHSRKMVDYTGLIFKRFGIAPTTGLDLCCGTGTAIGLLLGRGYIMSGLDGSSHMLALAAKKLKGRGVRLYHKTLPRFRLLSTVSSRKNVAFDFVFDSHEGFTRAFAKQFGMPPTKFRESNEEVELFIPERLRNWYYQRQRGEIAMSKKKSPETVFVQVLDRPAADRRHQVGRLEAGQNRDRQARTDTADADQALKNRLLIASEKTI